MKPNYLGTSLRSTRQAEKVKEFAKEKHCSGNVPDLLRAWHVVIQEACENGIPPEVPIACLDETIQLWQSKMSKAE